MTITAVLGLAFGDESKGAVTDALCRQAKGPVTTIRFSGGAQCGHNVVTPDGRHHTFRQFGAGTFAGAYTYLSRHMMVNPITIEIEARALERKGIKDPLSLVFIDRHALVTNLYQVAANRLTENLRGRNRHGSCGMGIGETVEDSIQHPEMALRVEDLLDRSALAKKLAFSRELKWVRFAKMDLGDHDPNWAAIQDTDLEFQVDRYQELGKRFRIVDRVRLRHLLAEGGDLIFEGAQGVLLDESYGFHPHTTWSKTTFENALDLLDEAGFDSAQVKQIGVIRGYATRHGAGPFPTEDPLIAVDPDQDNVTNEFQQTFRIGHFDAVLAKYAQRVVGRLDEVVVTNLDKIRTDRPKICTQYRLPQDVAFNTLPVVRPPDLKSQENITRDLSLARPVLRTLQSKQELVEAIQQALRAPVTWCSTGPTAADKIPGPQYMMTAVGVRAREQSLEDSR